jgi:hypothetical protein
MPAASFWGFALAPIFCSARRMKLRVMLVSLCLLHCGSESFSLEPRSPSAEKTTGLSETNRFALGCDVELKTPQTAPSGLAHKATIDVGDDLREVLQRKSIADACTRYNAGDHSYATELACGKYLFFYEHFGTIGVPTAMYRFVDRWYHAQFGDKLQAYGFIPDPDSDYPVGLVPSTGKIGGASTLAFTCAACHFSQANDGRYIVGRANQDLNYGPFLANLMTPVALSLGFLGELVGLNVHPSILAEKNGVADQVELNRLDLSYWCCSETSFFGLSLNSIGMLFAGAKPMLALPLQDLMLRSHAGTMDFLAPPIEEDGEYTLSAIPNLLDLPSAAEREERCIGTLDGTDHELLSLSGGVPSLQVFASTFVAIGKGNTKKWSNERLKPLATYVSSLRSPPVEAPSHPQGEALFVAGCASCHYGPRGESPGVFELSDDCSREGTIEDLPDGKIGSVCTETAYASLLGPDQNGIPQSPNLAVFVGQGAVVTRGVKAPRLSLVAERSLFLHHGSVNSLEALLCEEGPRSRPGRGEFVEKCMVSDPLSNTCLKTWTPYRGHYFGCELSEADKHNLIAYLRTL